MQFAHFTKPDGGQVPIVPAQIVNLRDPLRGEFPGLNVKTVIVLVNGGFQAVQETESEIEAILAKF